MTMSAEPGAAPVLAAPLIPKGPKGLPFLGNVIDIGRDTLGFFEKSARAYGDVTALQLPGAAAVIINNSDLIEQVLVKQHEKFSKNKVFWRQVEALLGNGLFKSEGAFWQRQRKLAAPAFATLPLQTYAPAMVDLAERMVDTWRDGEVIDVHQRMMTLGLRIAAKTLFNADVEAELG